MQSLEADKNIWYNVSKHDTHRIEKGAYIIHKHTLCTAYKSTVQTEQAGAMLLEPGRQSDSGYHHIRGTVVANTDTWVFFFYLFSSSITPTYLISR